MALLCITSYTPAETLRPDASAGGDMLLSASSVLRISSSVSQKMMARPVPSARLIASMTRVTPSRPGGSPPLLNSSRTCFDRAISASRPSAVPPSNLATRTHIGITSSGRRGEPTRATPKHSLDLARGLYRVARCLHSRSCACPGRREVKHRDQPRMRDESTAASTDASNTASPGLDAAEPLTPAEQVVVSGVRAADSAHEDSGPGRNHGAAKCEYEPIQRPLPPPSLT